MKLSTVTLALIVTLSAGIFIGRATIGSDSEQNDETRAKVKNARPARVTGRDSQRNDPRSIGRLGAAPPAGYKNRLLHMKALASKVGGGQGVPDFDALFGIWETAREMTPEDLQRALSEIETGSMVGLQERIFVKMMLVMQLAKKDGPMAMACTTRSSELGSMFPLRQMALSSWASNDPVSAYAWFESNKDKFSPSEASEFQASTIAALAVKDFPLAFSRLKAMEPIHRGEALAQMAAAVANNPAHRAKFTKFLLSLDKNESQNRAAQNLVRTLARSNAQEAIKYAESWPGKDKSEIYDSVASSWADSEPEKALDWRLQNLVEHEDFSTEIETIFGNWARRQSAVAEAWLAEKEGVPKDEMRIIAARLVRLDNDYPQAAKWISGVVNQQERTQHYTNIYSEWSALDKAGATRWANTLDPATRSKIIPTKSDDE